MHGREQSFHVGLKVGWNGFQVSVISIVPQQQGQRCAKGANGPAPGFSATVSGGEHQVSCDTDRASAADGHWREDRSDEFGAD